MADSRGAPDQELPLLSYEELKVISENRSTDSRLAKKVQKLFSTPSIDNSATRSGVQPRQDCHPELGPSIGVTTWNIEKSMSVQNALLPALQHEATFLAGLKSNLSAKKRKEAIEHRQRLLCSDIILLQEMDVGHPRSGCVNAPQTVARALNMNYTYAPHQLEVDPRYFGSERKKHGVDTQCYKGLFGTAILSRYPVKRSYVKQLKKKPYDWYSGEEKKLSFVEKLRRVGANVVLGEKMEREMKEGGRAIQIVDLHVPGQPNDTVSVVNVHLEIKTTPEQREAQMKEILKMIESIPNPVIMAGDFNSSSSDVSPTNLGRVVKNIVKSPSNMLSAAVSATTTASTPINLGRKVANAAKNYSNPMAPHIPVLLPNEQRGLFREIEDFQFADGGCFDFRSDKERSKGGLRFPWNVKASNSNERGAVTGFEHTFETERGSFLTYQRLDWVFVKGAQTHNCRNPKSGTYQMAPHYGEVLNGINRTQKAEFSDHDPMYVALPLEEPTQLNARIYDERRQSRDIYVPGHKGGPGTYVKSRRKPAAVPKAIAVDDSPAPKKKSFFKKLFRGRAQNNVVADNH